MASINANIPDVVVRTISPHTRDDIRSVFDGIFGKNAVGDSCLSSVHIANAAAGDHIALLQFSKLMTSTEAIRDFSDRINRAEEVNVLNVLGTTRFWKVSKQPIPPPSVLTRQIAETPLNEVKEEVEMLVCDAMTALNKVMTIDFDEERGKRAIFEEVEVAGTAAGHAVRRVGSFVSDNL